MHNKDKLSMYIDVTRITILICWVSLICFWLLKIFGGNFFEIMVQNKNFVEFSNLVQNSWLKYLVSFITIFVAKYLTACAVCQKFTFKGKDLLFVSGLIISNWAVVNFLNVDVIKMVYGYLIIMIISIIYQRKYGRLLGLLSIVLEFVFSTISALTRNISLEVSSNYLISAIMIIDLYLMTLLYYLYSNLIRIKRSN